MTSTLTRSLTAFLSIIALVGTSGCKLDFLVFDPTRQSEYRFPTEVVPESLRTLITFPSGGETIHGVHLRRPGVGPRLTVLLSHGKGGDISRPMEWKRAEAIWQAGYDVVAYDYRGYGKSTGSTTGEPSLLADARAALAYTIALPGVSARTLVLYGHSLGGVPTTALASTFGRTSDALRGVVLESSFASGAAMARTATILDIPGKWLIDGRYDNVGRLADIHAPILILAGSEDIQVPRAQTDELYARANAPKRLQIVTGAVHDDIPSKLGSTAFASLLRTLTAPLP